MPELPRIHDGTFADEVFRASQPTLVEFWAEWCQPCQVADKILQEVAAAFGPALRVVRLDVDESPVAPLLYGVHTVPTLILFRQEEEKLRVTGTFSKESLLRKIRDALQTPR
ncbi:MAG: thiol reductase thioredoxin [Clostridiales bacterium]|nr:thiol reductase thioredoxin [Clostridiales bacterium]